MPDAELIDRSFRVLVEWMKPDGGLSDRDALYRLAELFEQSGRQFFKADYPAND